MQFWGITDYTQVCKQVWYQIAVEQLRPELYQINVDFEHLACQRGDLVAVSHDVLLNGLVSARVLSITTDGGGNALTVTVDEDCIMEAGKSYALRWRRMDGASVLANLVTVIGTQRTLTFSGTVVLGTVPEPGDLCSYGIQGSETAQMLVVSVEPKDEFSATVTLNNYNASVYNTDSGSVPAWTRSRKNAVHWNCASHPRR